MKRILTNQFFILLGPLLFLILLLIGPIEGMPRPAFMVLASTLWIAIWWVSEAIPIPITSLLPLVLFPMTGVMKIGEAAAPFAKPIIFLFLGGFIIALAIERWNLHKRIALGIIALVGTNMRQILLGFILASGLLSMWISNTATTVMMLPIAISVVAQLQALIRDQQQSYKGSEVFGQALILSIAYSASIGGMATLVGTPTNLIFTESVREIYGIEIPFDQWFGVGLPISLCLLFVCWWHLSHNAFDLSKAKIAGSEQLIRQELQALGPLKAEERRVLVVFLLVALAWISRRYLIAPFFPNVDDTIIALVGAFCLFVIPAPSEPGKMLMNWQTALKVPWGVLLLFGGAFAVAASFEVSGLTAWIGEKLKLLQAIPFWLILLIIIAVVNFLTEITQNMATCTLMMPIMAALAGVLDVHPFVLMAAACITASCAFMLPVATAPNAVVFASGYLRMKDMVRAGFLLNILSILVIMIFIYFLMPLIWGIELQGFPTEWREGF